MRLVEPGGMHGFNGWRGDFETIAIALARNSDPDALPEARAAVCSYFWAAPSGPVATGRLGPKSRTPALLAKHITADIAAASAWWGTLTDRERAAYLRGERPTASSEARA
jgi:hypothetical protein